MKQREAVLAYTAVVIAMILGIVGMNLIYQGIAHGSFVTLSRGVPLLLIGLWWNGHELRRSIDASQARRERRQRADGHH